jgi:hypothetical protein
VVCRKLLRISPGAVRTHCTLAWLALGRGLAAEIEPALEAYVGAARRGRQEGLATRQLRLMAEVADDARLRALVARKLRELGDDASAGVIEASLAEADQPVPMDRQERWAMVARAALLGPDELKGRVPSRPPPP